MVRALHNAGAIAVRLLGGGRVGTALVAVRRLGGAARARIVGVTDKDVDIVAGHVGHRWCLKFVLDERCTVPQPRSPLKAIVQRR
jgi:hypothetical protein